MTECKGDDLAFPMLENNETGLTKREYFAAKMLASLMPIAARDGDDIEMYRILCQICDESRLVRGQGLRAAGVLLYRLEGEQ